MKLSDRVHKLATRQQALSFSEIVSIALEIEKLEEENMFLHALKAAGVDNWSGYDYAFDILEEWENG